MCIRNTQRQPDVYVHCSMSVYPELSQPVDLGSGYKEGPLEAPWGGSCLSASIQPSQDSAKKNWPVAPLGSGGGRNLSS